MYCSYLLRAIADTEFDPQANIARNHRDTPPQRKLRDSSMSNPSSPLHERQKRTEARDSVWVPRGETWQAGSVDLTES